MLKTLFGSKKKMGATYIQGARIPVTYINAGPCVVTQIKEESRDGYWALQFGFGEKRIKNTSKSIKGHLKQMLQNTKNPKFNKDSKVLPRYIREVRFSSKPDFQVGDVVTLSDVFKKGDVVTVSGTSKGKGFAGGVKRWHFGGGPKTHGQSDRHRAPGSIGQGTTPGRVHKGKKMAGRMGNETITIKNLYVVAVDEEKNTIGLSGSVPGPVGGFLTVTKTGSGKLSELLHETQKVEVAEEDSGEESPKESQPTESKEYKSEE